MFVFSLLLFSACGGGSSSSDDSLPITVINSTAVGEVIITGTLIVGKTVQISQNLSDSNGLGTLNYQWQRTINSVSSIIENENSVDYIIREEDIGYTLFAEVSYTDNDGFSEAVLSDSTAVIAGNTVTKKPNVLLIIADDQGVDASAQYNFSTDLPDTPRINLLAEQGITFDNAWATPACTTTRGTLITGQHGINSGISYVPAVMDTETVTLQRYIKSFSESNDYQTAVVGKWHLGGSNPDLSHPIDSGIDYYAGTIKGTLTDYYDWELTENGVNSVSNVYHTTKITDLAIDWLDEQNQQDKPWFMWLAYVAPHSPFHLPPEDLHNRDHLTGSDIDTNKREYYLAAIEAMDAEIGRLIDSLSVEDRANTLIIYVGDNGTPASVIDTSVYERTHSKGTLFEGGIRVPMVVAGSGVTRKNVRESALVNTSDFYATISHFIGNSVMQVNDSYSFVDLLSQTGNGLRNYNYSEFESNDITGWAVRNEDYKLIEYEDGLQALYLLNDGSSNNISETDNLIADSENTGIIAELKEQAQIIRQESSTSPIDITDAILTARSANCSDYLESYQSTVLDVNNGTVFNGELMISLSGEQCIFQTNNIPNHDFNDAAQAFPNDVSAQNNSFTISTNPTHAASTTAVSLQVDNAILLNGVKVDLLAAACFGVGDGKVGCNDINQAWRYDPMFVANGFRVDTHNAHSQPDGSYHYHGKPNALYQDDDNSVISPLVGFAADGYPIFGSYFDDNGLIRKAVSSFQVISGSRPAGTGAPGGNYDGTYRDDYQYVESYGDLDECNGMTINGVYGYYITDGYPYILSCFKGIPDSSFNK
ncbi:MAG: sulfatase-like hydrolase/transferase [Colwellia sp.]|nr:sulfatase-like hydrolase/transferase [Colwellia sp.]